MDTDRTPTLAELWEGKTPTEHTCSEIVRILEHMGGYRLHPVSECPGPFMSTLEQLLAGVHEKEEAEWRALGWDGVTRPLPPDISERYWAPIHAKIAEHVAEVDRLCAKGLPIRSGSIMAERIIKARRGGTPLDDPRYLPAEELEEDYKDPLSLARQY
jgi:hypothetical protein